MKKEPPRDDQHKHGLAVSDWIQIGLLTVTIFALFVSTFAACEARNATRIGQRAYLMVDSVRVNEPPTSQPPPGTVYMPGVLARVKNVGVTPATEVFLALELGARGPVDPSKDGQNIGPGQAREFPMPGALVRSVLVDRTQPLRVVIAYRDMFGNAHVTRACHVFEPALRIFRLCDQGHELK